MIHAYFVRYRLYGVNNAAHFHGMSQYTNWTYVMEQGFGDQFEVISIDPYDI